MKPFTIRTILLSTITILTLLIVGLAIREVYAEGKIVLQIQALKRATVTSDKLFETVEKYSVARDITSSLIYAKDNETIAALRPMVDDAQKAADESLTASIESLQQYNFSEIGDEIAETEASLQKLKVLRQQLKDSISNNDEKQRQILSNLWFQQVTDLILSTQSLWMEFVKHFSDIDPTVTLQMRFKHLLGILMERTGRERAVIGRLIVENAAPTPEQQVNLLTWHGAVEMGWERLHSLSVQSNLDDTISPYIKDAESHYLNLYGMVHDMFYVPGVKHLGYYPIGAEFWLELSTQTTDSLYELKDASVKESAIYREKLEKVANRKILLNISIMVISFGLCFYSLWVVVFRVITPINNMVGELVKVVADNPVAMAQTISNLDEIGKLGVVLLTVQQSSRRYQALVEASSQLIWIWKPDEESGMEDLKEWWEKTTGQPKEEILPFGWLEVVHPDDREMAGKAWEESSTHGKNFEIEYRVKAKNGEYKYLSFRGVPLKNEDGSISEVVGALNDVTIRKQDEENLLTYTQALERSNKELDDFAYIASHDLKEPLRGLHNHARFLLEDNTEKLDEDSVGRLGRLVYLSQRMERLVNDLLYFSRLGRQELAIQETNLNEVLKDVEDTLDVFLNNHKAKIVLPKPLPEITCDTTRVTEIFRNLITNAVKYNDNEQKTVEIGFIDAFPGEDGQTIKNVHYVKDNGRGIAPEFYEEIFRIFKRLQSAKKNEEEGTGVGLTFVKKIVERHGGKIWLESQPGLGTTFYFTLDGVNYDKSNT